MKSIVFMWCVADWIVHAAVSRTNVTRERKRGRRDCTGRCSRWSTLMHPLIIGAHNKERLLTNRNNNDNLRLQLLLLAMMNVLLDGEEIDPVVSAFREQFAVCKENVTHRLLVLLSLQMPPLVAPGRELDPPNQLFDDMNYYRQMFALNGDLRRVIGDRGYFLERFDRAPTMNWEVELPPYRERMMQRLQWAIGRRVRHFGISPQNHPAQYSPLFVNLVWGQIIADDGYPHKAASVIANVN